MLELIFTWLLDAVAGGLELIMAVFFNMMTFNMDDFVQLFPIAGTLYTILQSVGVGLVLGITIFQLLKYFAAPLSKVNETPMTLVFRTFLAIGLIYFGNFFLMQIFNVSGHIFNNIKDVDVKTDIIKQMTSMFSVEGIAGSIGSIVSGVFSATMLIVNLIMILSILINCVKMMIEIVERYLMLCILIYTSPLAWAAMTSYATTDILKKWFSMFFGQCLLLVLSVWGCKMFISVLLSVGPAVFTKIIYATAFIRIIKKFDDHLNRIGINAASGGGGNILSDLLVGASVAGKVFGGKGGGNSSSNILGGGKGGSLIGAINGFTGRTAFNKGMNAATKNGASFKDSVKAGFSEMKSSFGERRAAAAQKRAESGNPLVNRIFSASKKPAGGNLSERANARLTNVNTAIQNRNATGAGKGARELASDNYLNATGINTKDAGAISDTVKNAVQDPKAAYEFAACSKYGDCNNSAVAEEVGQSLMGGEWNQHVVHDGETFSNGKISNGENGGHTIEGDVTSVNGNTRHVTMSTEKMENASVVQSREGCRGGSGDNSRQTYYVTSMPIKK